MSTSGLTATHIADVFDVNLIYARQLFQSRGEDVTLEDVQKLIKSKPKPFVKWVGGKRQNSIGEVVRCHAYQSRV